MPATKSNQEIEIKLRVKDVLTLRRRLKHLHARVVSPRTHESNTLYDTPKKDLARHDLLIRIRTEQTTSHAAHKQASPPIKTILTYKGPPRTARRLETVPSKGKARYKVREEIEVAISDAEQLHQILYALGLGPVFRYEKFRTTYALSAARNLKIELDETPIGTFLELEGTPSAIDRAAKLLGYRSSEYITETYGALYIAACRSRGRKPANMLFRRTKKSP